MVMSELERKREQRKTGIAAAERVAKVAGEAEGVIMTAAQKRKSALKGRSAEGLAAAVSGAPQTGLGARAAAAQEIAKKQGLAEGDVVAGSMEKAQAAREGAAEADLELQKYKREAGSTLLDVRKRTAEIEADITGLKDEFSHWYGDDEEGFVQALLTLVKDEDPQVRDSILTKYKASDEWGEDEEPDAWKDYKPTKATG